MKSYFPSLDVCFPTEHRTNFPQSLKDLAHICQIKWNLISFDDENYKKTLNKRSYKEKNLNIYSRTIHAPLVQRSSFQLIVVVKMLSW